MLRRASAALLLLFLYPNGCTKPIHLKYQATGSAPELLAVYEGWFGHPRHISIGYSSHDPATVQKQIEEAKAMGISGFVVDWYGDREPFINQSYALVQSLAAKNNFQVAMIYDETTAETGASDEAIADLNMFHDTYLAANADGHQAYLTYQGRPVIFVFSHGGYTNWDEVRTALNRWNPAPFLIQENLPGKYPGAFDGDYAWINPGPKGWAANGSNWGKLYLAHFYQTMGEQYSDRIIIGGAWSQFNDSRASWGLNRHISARCGATLTDTLNLWRKFFPAGQTIPFVLVETWNDYEEGSDIEPGIPACGGKTPVTSLTQIEVHPSTAQGE